MEEIVSAIFIDKTKILLFKRASYKIHYANMWNSISGKKEEGETVEECLKREIFEELGINNFEIKRKSDRLLYKDGDREWFVNIFILNLFDKNIKLNKEHSEYRWFDLDNLPREECSQPLLTDLNVMFQI